MWPDRCFHDMPVDGFQVIQVMAQLPMDVASMIRIVKVVWEGLDMWSCKLFAAEDKVATTWLVRGTESTETSWLLPVASCWHGVFLCRWCWCVQGRQGRVLCEWPWVAENVVDNEINHIPWVTVTVCHGVVDTVDNHIPQVTVTVCCGVAETDTVTVTITTMTKILQCHLHLWHTLDVWVQTQTVQVCKMEGRYEGHGTTCLGPGQLAEAGAVFTVAHCSTHSLSRLYCRYYP